MLSQNNNLKVLNEFVSKSLSRFASSSENIEIPCIALGNNRYQITIDAEKLKNTQGTISFIDAKNKKEIASFEINSEKIKFAGQGNHIELDIHGLLNASLNYEFNNPNAGLDLRADFAAKENLSVVSDAKCINYIGNMHANTLDIQAKGEVKIALESKLEINNLIKIKSSGLELNGSIKTKADCELNIENDLIFGAKGQCSANDLTANAKNIKNYSQKLTFLQANFAAQDEFINYSSGMIDTKNLLQVTGNRFWNAGRIDYGKKFIANLKKSYVQGVTKKDELNNFINDHSHQAVMEGEDVDITTDTYINLFSLSKVRHLKVRAKEETNTGTTYSTLSNKVRDTSLDLGFDYPNFPQLKKDTKLFSYYIESGDYANALLLVLETGPGLKLTQYAAYIEKEIYPRLDKNLQCSLYEALLYVSSNPALLENISAFKEGKYKGPQFVLIKEAIQTIRDGLVLKKHYASAKDLSLASFANQLAAKIFQPTIYSSADKEETIGGEHVSGIINRKANYLHANGTKETAVIIKKHFKKLISEKGLEVADQRIRIGEEALEAGKVIVNADTSNINKQIESGTTTAQEINWQALDFKGDGNITAETANIDATNLYEKGNLKINKLNTHASNTDFLVSAQLGSANINGDKINLDGDYWIDQLDASLSGVVAQGNQVKFAEGSRTLGDAATIAVAGHDTKLFGTQNLHRIIAFAENALSVDGKTTADIMQTKSGGKTDFLGEIYAQQQLSEADELYVANKLAAKNPQAPSSLELISRITKTSPESVIDHPKGTVEMKSTESIKTESKENADAIKRKAPFIEDNSNTKANILSNEAKKILKQGGDKNIQKSFLSAPVVYLDGLNQVLDEYVKAETLVDKSKTKAAHSLTYAVNHLNMKPASSVTGNQLNLETNDAKLNGQIAVKTLHLSADHIENIKQLLLQKGPYNNIKVSDELKLVTKDYVLLDEKTNVPYSITLVASAIDITADFQGEKDLKFVATTGDLNTNNNNIFANKVLMIDAANNYNNNRGNLYGGEALLVHAGKNAINTAGVWRSPVFLQVTTDEGNVLNQAIQYPVAGQFGPIMQYIPAQIFGGNGKEHEGYGLLIKSAAKFINDASQVSTLSSNYIYANTGIDSVARFNPYMSYHKKWHKWNGDKETKEYSWQIQPAVICAISGKNYLATNGQIYFLTTNLFGGAGNEVSGKGDITFQGLVLETTCTKDSNAWFGLDREHIKEKTEHNTPTQAVTYKDTKISSEADLNLLNCLIQSVGDLYLKGENIIVNSPILNHSLVQDKWGFGINLPGLSLILGYSAFNDLLGIKNGNNTEKFINAWNLGLDGLNTYNAALLAYNSNDFTKLINPTIEVTYTHSHTENHEQTLPTNVGIFCGGSFYSFADHKICFLNGVPVIVNGDAALMADSFVQKGAELKRSSQSHTESVSAGVDMTGNPSAGASASMNELEQTIHANQVFQIGGKLITYLNHWHMNAANVVANEWMGNVGDLAIETPLDTTKSKSASVEANTHGYVSANYSTSNSKTIGTASGIHIRSSINGENNKLIYVKSTKLEGAKITSNGENNYETETLINKEVKEEKHEYTIGIAANIKDFQNQKDQQQGKSGIAIPCANVPIGFVNYAAKQIPTIFGEKGTAPKINNQAGELNTQDNDGKVVKKDQAVHATVKVPIPNEYGLRELKENHEKFFGKKETQESSLKVINLTDEEKASQRKNVKDEDSVNNDNKKDDTESKLTKNVKDKKSESDKATDKEKEKKYYMSDDELKKAIEEIHNTDFSLKSIEYPYTPINDFDRNVREIASSNLLHRMSMWDRKNESSVNKGSKYLEEHAKSASFMDYVESFNSGMAKGTVELYNIARHPLIAAKNLGETLSNRLTEVTENLQKPMDQWSPSPAEKTFQQFKNADGLERTEMVAALLPSLTLVPAAGAGVSAIARTALPLKSLPKKTSTKNIYDRLEIDPRQSAEIKPIQQPKFAENTTQKAPGGEGALEQRVLANITESKTARETSNFPVLAAREDQILAGYNVDQWIMTTLNKGDIVYGGLPGQSNYYTNLDTILASNGDKDILGKLLQVNPHPEKGYRPNIGQYIITKDVRIPTGIVTANPNLGIGNSTHFFINKDLNLLRLNNEYTLENFYELNMPGNKYRY